MLLILEILVCGLTGAALMTATMALIHRSGWANADMIRAVGSLVTGRLEGAAKVGALVHALAGMAFAFGYVGVLRLVVRNAPSMAAPLGAVLGIVHGIVVGYVIVAGLSRRHPVARFRDAGVPVAAAHVVGHAAYGFGVGAMMALLRMHG